MTSICARYRSKLEPELKAARAQFKQAIAWRPPRTSKGNYTLKEIRNRGGSLAWAIQGRLNGEHIRRRFQKREDAIKFGDNTKAAVINMTEKQ